MIVSFIQAIFIQVYKMNLIKGIITDTADHNIKVKIHRKWNYMTFNNKNHCRNLIIHKSNEDKEWYRVIKITYQG